MPAKKKVQCFFPRQGSRRTVDNSTFDSTTTEKSTNSRPTTRHAPSTTCTKPQSDQSCAFNNQPSDSIPSSYPAQTVNTSLPNFQGSQSPIDSRPPAHLPASHSVLRQTKTKRKIHTHTQTCPHQQPSRHPLPKRKTPPPSTPRPQKSPSTTPPPPTNKPPTPPHNNPPTTMITCNSTTTASTKKAAPASPPPPRRTSSSASSTARSPSRRTA